MAEISTDGLGDWWDRASQAERDSFERDVYDALNTALRLWGPKASSILLRQVDDPSTNERDRMVALMAHRVQMWEHGLEAQR